MAKDEIVEPRGIVKANNELFRSRCKIKDVVAGRIFMAFASLVDEKDIAENGNFLEYKISVSSVLNDTNAGGDNYRQLRDAAYSLVDQKIEKRKSKTSFTVYTLFSKIDYSDGIIKGEFHKDLIPFFIATKGVFTRLNLQQYIKLQSTYSQKLFGFLKSWDDKPEVNISVAELHEMLDTSKSSRQNFAELRRYILEKAHKDIHAQTSLRYDWEPVKRGRAVESVRFIFSKRRTLPVAKAKNDDVKEKQAQSNNAAFLKALACFNERGQACEGGHQKQAICALCRTIR